GGPSRFMATLRSLLGGAHPAGRTSTTTTTGTSAPSGKPRHADATASLLARLHATGLLHPAGGKQQADTPRHDDTPDAASTLHALVLPTTALNVRIPAPGAVTQSSSPHVGTATADAARHAHGASPGILRALAQPQQRSPVATASTHISAHAGTAPAATPAQTTATAAPTAPAAPAAPAMSHASATAVAWHPSSFTLAAARQTGAAK